MGQLTCLMSRFVRQLALVTLVLCLAIPTLMGFTHTIQLHITPHTVMLAGLSAVAIVFWLLRRRYVRAPYLAIATAFLAVLFATGNARGNDLAVLAFTAVSVLVVRYLNDRAKKRDVSKSNGHDNANLFEDFFNYVYRGDSTRTRPTPSVRSSAQPATPASAHSAAQPPTPGYEKPEPTYPFDSLVTFPKQGFSEVIGMADTKKRLLAAAREILVNPVGARNGVVLSGPPGTGKTFIVRALAGELGVPLFALDYGSVASKWINETPARVRAAFAQARQLGSVVFFIDEFDSFCKPRHGDVGAPGAHHMDLDLTNTLLTEIVGLRDTRVILVAATNRLDTLDAASIREGRFDYRLEVPAPDLEARTAILRRSVGEAMGFHALPAPLLASLAERWSGFSAARLASVGRELADMRREGVVGPGALTFDVVMKAMRRLQGSRGKLPENIKPLGEIIMPGESRRLLSDLAFRMRHVYSLEKIGGRAASAVIFLGPPGVGKTAAALALAKASGYAFLKTTGAELLRAPCAWDRLVREARDLRPAIVFIDEAEDVLGHRQHPGIASVTNRILTTLDGADGRVPDVMYVCATNSPLENLDTAVRRGGRFEEAIRFAVPEPDQLTAYVTHRMKIMAADIFAVSRNTIAFTATSLQGRSIADCDAVLQRIIDTVAIRQIRGDSATITLEDVRSALSRTASF